jgi:phosphatidyl-myo-inositol alpha-mannosyltransferase
VLFRSEDVTDLADKAIGLLDDPVRRKQLNDEAALAVRRYDWSSVAGRVVQVYETVVGGDAR